MTKIDIGDYQPRHLSHSTIGSYRMCGKKFELTKVLHLEERPGLAALGGNAVHVASEKVDELIHLHGFEVFSADVDICNDESAQ